MPAHIDQLDPSLPPTVGTLALTFAAWLAHAHDEELHVAYLAADGRVLAIDSTQGRADAVELPLRRIIAEALRHDARALVLAHNHPSGDTMPSHGDIAATRRLADLAHGLDLRVLDHLIFSSGHWRSFRALELL